MKPIHSPESFSERRRDSGHVGEPCRQPPFLRDRFLPAGHTYQICRFRTVPCQMSMKAHVRVQGRTQARPRSIRWRQDWSQTRSANSGRRPTNEAQGVLGVTHHVAQRHRIELREAIHRDVLDRRHSRMGHSFSDELFHTGNHNGFRV